MTDINKEYITNLPYKQEKELRSASGKEFLEALEATYGRKKVIEASCYLIESMPNTFSGTQEFKRRFEASLLYNENLLSVDDQKYIADITKRIATGQMKIDY